MQLRTFTARTAQEAMAEAREALGDDAVMLSTETTPDGCTTITAAAEAGGEPMPPPVAGTLPDGTELDCAEAVLEVISGHGMPPRLVDRIYAAAVAAGTDEPLAALAAGFAACIDFAPIGDAAPAKPLMLVGPPGAGKTLTAAKLAARAVLARRPVRMLTTDMMRAGAVEQLAAFARVLDIPLETIGSERQLTLALAGLPPGTAAIVDTAGINPYNPSDRDELAGLIAAAAAEPLFVVPAGGDLFDMVDTGDVFFDLGCRRFVATRLDIVRRIGSIVAVAAGSGLAPSEGGVGASVAEGLIPLGPRALASLFLPVVAAGAQTSSSELVPS
jgi:flagellar biosynthesis protein FlhF